MHGHIGGSYDLTAVIELFDPVSRPSRDTGYREQGSIELDRKIEHAVDKATVEIDIRRYTLVDASLLGNKLGRDLLDP